MNGRNRSYLIAIIFVLVAIAQIVERNPLAIFPLACAVYFWIRGRRKEQ